MLLRIAGQFCATRPFYVIGFWILLMVAAGAVSQVYLEDALSNGRGQGPTKDLEFTLAKKMRDEKIALPAAIKDQDVGKDLRKVDQSDNSDTESSETVLVITSATYLFPSEHYINSVNDFLSEIQTKIDSNPDINRDVGTIEDYPVSPSPDGTTIMIPAPFLSLIHI